MSLVEELKSVLPTPLARLSVLLTGVLLTPAFLAPPFLKPWLWPTATEKELVLLQILATIVVLFVGTFITILSVWHHHAFGKGRQKKRLAELYLQALKNRGDRNP